MEIPVFRSGRWVKACKKFSDFLDGYFYRYVIAPAIFILPLSLLLTITSDTDLFSKFISLMPSSIKEFLEESQVLLISVLFLFFHAGKALEGFIKKSANPDSELTRDDLHAILALLNEVVSGKMVRFLGATKQALREKWAHGRIFKEITRPDQQIGLLVKAVHGFFECFTKNEISFRVGLMRVIDDALVDWVAFYPPEHPPKATITALSSPTSAIMRAIEARGPIIVSDTFKELLKRKELRNFVKGSESSKHDDSSILTYPVYCPNTKKPIYVLSILAKRKNCIEEKHLELYKWIINHFLQRLLIEHHLLIMKGEST